MGIILSGMALKNAMMEILKVLMAVHRHVKMRVRLIERIAGMGL